MLSLENLTSSNHDRYELCELSIKRFLADRDNEPITMATADNDLDSATTSSEPNMNDDLDSTTVSLEPNNNNDLDSATTFSEPNKNDDAVVDDTEPTPDAGLYRDFIVRTPAYSWLIASLQREATLTRAAPDLMENIKEEVLGALSSPHRVSRNALSQQYKATFELAWDPLSFVREQQYTETPEEALESAITLTGAANDAQAMTTREYLCQTWPATGKHLMQLVTDVVRNSTNYYVACE